MNLQKLQKNVKFSQAKHIYSEKKRKKDLQISPEIWQIP